MKKRRKAAKKGPQLLSEVAKVERQKFPVGSMVRIRSTGELGFIEMARERLATHPPMLFRVRTDLYCSCSLIDRCTLNCFCFVFSHEIDFVAGPATGEPG